ncbi:glycine receptor subunit alphaZ1-like [Neocloeon triangulifer]|uniref:glycine receptor subunit alphaZ1-like n=1 Tax=Neocloeon triangulifer TaxID=2078957 RepID=UPI00286F7394|nr:glycine receptor subunit alphaZ1-like [Neocloeon triangulifer]
MRLQRWLGLVVSAFLALCAPLMTVEGQQRIPTNLYEIVPTDYTIHEPPPLLDGKPVPVEFSVSVKNIPNLDELKQELSMELNLRIYWVDQRLQVGPYFEAFPNNTYMNANPALLNKIWIPDVYTDYTKSVSAPKILAAPASLRIYPNTTVRYSARITMQFACPMDFRKYPADTQSCDMSLESYAFTRDKIYFSWRPEGASINIAHRLAHFDFDFHFNNDKENVNFPSGSYPAITLTVLLHRRISYHMLQTYIPSLMFVIVSWLSFLVPPESVPGRMAICMTTLLTLTAMFAAVRQSTPSVSYVKGLDIWMVVCIFFVFLTLVEYTLVLRLTKNLKKNQSPPTSAKKPEPSTNSKASPMEPQMQPAKNGEEASAFHKFTGDVVSGPPSTESPRTCLTACIGGDGPDCWRNPTKRGILILETISCICIPGAFILFNFFYWPFLLTNSDVPVNSAA